MADAPGSGPGPRKGVEVRMTRQLRDIESQHQKKLEEAMDKKP